jgi:hypothetical protein
MEIDKELARTAIKAIERLAKHGTKEQKEHFAKVLAKLADCYGEESTTHALLLVSDDDCLYTMSINTDPWEAAGLVQMCYDNMNLKVFQKMPDEYQAH